MIRCKVPEGYQKSGIYCEFGDWDFYKEFSYEIIIAKS